MATRMGYVIAKTLASPVAAVALKWVLDGGDLLTIRNDHSKAIGVADPGC